MVTTEKPASASLAEHLNAARKRAGLSQMQLAQIAGVSPKTVAKIEDGGTIRSDAIVRLAGALGQPINEWLKLGGKSVSQARIDDLLEQHFTTPTLSKLSLDEYFQRTLERLDTHGNIGLRCICVTYPISMMASSNLENVRKTTDAGLHTALVVPFPIRHEERAPTLSVYYSEAYAWAYGIVSPFGLSIPNDHIKIFVPRMTTDKNSILVYPPTRLAEECTVLTQYGYGDKVMFELGVYVHHLDNRPDHWIDICSGGHTANARAIETFRMWEDYLRDILDVWAPKGKGKDSKVTYDLNTSSFWQKASFDRTA